MVAASEPLPCQGRGPRSPIRAATAKFPLKDVLSPLIEKLLQDFSVAQGCSQLTCSSHPLTGREHVTGVLKMASIWEIGDLAALPCQQPKKDISHSCPRQRPPRDYIVPMCRAFLLHCYKHPLYVNAQLGIDVSTIFAHGLALSSAVRQCCGHSNRFADPVLQVPALILNQELKPAPQVSSHLSSTGSKTTRRSPRDHTVMGRGQGVRREGSICSYLVRASETESLKQGEKR